MQQVVIRWTRHPQEAPTIKGGDDWRGVKQVGYAPIPLVGRGGYSIGWRLSIAVARWTRADLIGRPTRFPHYATDRGVRWCVSICATLGDCVSGPLWECAAVDLRDCALAARDVAERKLRDAIRRAMDLSRGEARLIEIHHEGWSW